MVVVYGFGSYFAGSQCYKDIDILLVHDDISEESCKAAILLKKRLMQTGKRFHVSILSKAECAEINLINKANAGHIGLIANAECPFELDELIVGVEYAHNKAIQADAYGAADLGR